jgi:hypothetical protein
VAERVFSKTEQSPLRKRTPARKKTWDSLGIQDVVIDFIKRRGKRYQYRGDTLHSQVEGNGSLLIFIWNIMKAIATSPQ